MDSFQKIIDAFGRDRLAEAIGVTQSHVRVMRARDSIPPVYWPDLVLKASSDLRPQITFELLKTLRDRRSAASAASPDSHQRPEMEPPQ